MWFSFIVLATILGVCLSRPILKLLTPKGIPDIPRYTSSAPLFGDTPRIGLHLYKTGSLISFINQTIARHGVISQLVLGPRGRIVILTDYQEIQNILTHRAKSFDRSHHMITCFGTIIPQALIALPNNEMYKRHKRVLGLAMTSRYVNQASTKSGQAIRGLIGAWKERVGEVWDCKGDLYKVTLESICGMTFGGEIGVNEEVVLCGEMKSDEEKNPSKVVLDTRDLTAVLQSLPINAIFPTLKHWYIRNFTSFPKHARGFDRYFTAKIAESRQRVMTIGLDDAEEMADNALDMIIIKQMRGGECLTDEELKQELMLYIAAGSETTDITLSWFIKYMTNNPDVQKTLRRHLIESNPELEDGTPTYSDLHPVKTPYLEAVVHEVLRLGHVAAGMTRDAVEDVIILGRHIPKGTTILIPNITSMEDLSTPASQVQPHRPEPANLTHNITPLSPIDKSMTLANALVPLRTPGPDRKVGFWLPGTGSTFDPTRWLDSQGNFDITKGPSLPFAAGPRGCFGQKLAMMSLRMYFAHLSLSFFFDGLEEGLNSYDTVETHSSHPKSVYIKPVLWRDVEKEKS